MTNLHCQALTFAPCRLYALFHALKRLWRFFTYLLHAHLLFPSSHQPHAPHRTEPNDPLKRQSGSRMRPVFGAWQMAVNARGSCRCRLDLFSHWLFPMFWHNEVKYCPHQFPPFLSSPALGLIDFPYILPIFYPLLFLSIQHLCPVLLPLPPSLPLSSFA